MAAITPIVMPKWGLEMREGTIVDWLVEEGARIAVGTPILDVETDKISNAVEAPDPGLLRRRIAKAGEVLPVKALLGVLAEPAVSDEEIDAFIAGYVVPPAGDGEETAESAYRFVEVDGLSLRYARKGTTDGTPVVFIHGFGGDLDNWLFNLDAVGESNPVIALDLPGHGQSDVRLPAASLAALAGVVSRFLAAVDVPRAHLVGHSMGGAIASQLALDEPTKVASLSLIGSAGLGAEINRSYIDGFVDAPSRRELKPVLEQLFADPSLVNRQLVDDVLKYKRLDGVGTLLRTLADGIFPRGEQAGQPGRRLDGGKTPVLVIWGKEDRIVPSAHAANAPKGARVEVFDGAGHMVQMEKAGEVNRLIKERVAG